MENDLSYNFHKVFSILERIESKVDSLHEIVDDLMDEASENKEYCEKMSKHIDFVDNVYDNVRHPLNFIVNKVNYLRGKETENLVMAPKQELTYENETYYDLSNN